MTSLSPLFKDKPFLLVLTKSDLVSFDNISQDDKNLISEANKTCSSKYIIMSALMRDNISEVKTTACDILLEHRLSKKHLGEKKNDSILSRLYVAQPKARDNLDRHSHIPQSVIDKMNDKTDNMEIESKKEERISTLIDKNGGHGVYYVPSYKF